METNARPESRSTIASSSGVEAMRTWSGSSMTVSPVPGAQQVEKDGVPPGIVEQGVAQSHQLFGGHVVLAHVKIELSLPLTCRWERRFSDSSPLRPMASTSLAITCMRSSPTSILPLTKIGSSAPSKSAHFLYVSGQVDHFDEAGFVLEIEIAVTIAFLGIAQSQRRDHAAKPDFAGLAPFLSERRWFRW